MQNRLNIIDALEAARKAQGLTQSELATRSGTTRVTVGRIESGHDPKLSTVYEMARALGLDAGPMSGFNNALVDEAFFAGAAVRSNFLINLGYGDHSKLHARNPRLSFDQALALEQAQDKAISTLSPVTLPSASGLHDAWHGIVNFVSQLFHRQSAAAVSPCIVASLPAADGRPSVTYRQAGDKYILLEYGDNVLDLRLRFRIHALMEALKQQPISGIHELSPGVRSLQIRYDSRVVHQRELIKQLLALEHGLPPVDSMSVPTRVVYLPLAFEDSATLDAVTRYRETVKAQAPWLPNNVDFIQRINGLASRAQVEKIVYEASYMVLGLGDVYLGAPVATPSGAGAAPVAATILPSDWGGAAPAQFPGATSFPSGPPAVSAVVRGAKIYDWRTGLTAFSENPSVIARDWALYSYGGGCTIDEIVLPAFTTAANTSDVSTTFVSSSGTEVRPLYQCGIVIPLDANPDEAMNEIVESMAGKWGWAGGRLTLRAGAYRAPVATIDESWITDVDRVQIVGETATAELINTMRPTIADAAQAYVPVPLADVSAAAFVSADGGDLPLEVELGGVTRAVQAQNICGVLMRENREGLTVTLPCNLRAYPLELFDVVALNLPTFGWANKEVEVQGWSFSLTGGVSLTVREIVAGNYTPDALFRVSTVSNNTYLLDPTQVETLSITSIDSSATGLVDGSLVARVKLTWTAAVAESVRRGGQIEIQYIEAGGASSAGDWQAAPLERGSVTSTTIGGLKMGVNYLFRIRAYNALGVKGRWSLHSLHQVTAAQLETWQLTNEAATTVLTDADPGPISLGRLSVPNIPGAQAAVDLPVLTRAVRVRVTATFNTRLTNGATAINGVSAYLSIIDTGTGVGFSGNKVQFPNVGSSPWPCAPTPVASATVEGVTTITHTFDYDPTVDNPRTVLLTAGLEGTTPTSASASLYSLSFNVEVIKA